jgi:diguanylate cyclase (GGDEF)-like protein
VDRETGELVSAALTPDAQELLVQYPRSGCNPHANSELWGWVMKNKKPILTNLPALDPRFKGIPEDHFPVGQFLCAPAVMSGKLVGIIAVANSEKMYSEKDLDVVERLATFYAIAIDRVWREQELRELSLEDELTKLSNRRGFMTLAEQQFRVANRSKKEMFLLYADLDDLKVINDTLGHEEGDGALAETAAVLREAFRESDIIARVGGDEFVVLAIDAGDGRADVLNQRLREKIEVFNARPNRKYVLSLSLGTARYDPEKPCSIQDLINRADKRMYQDKLARKRQLS